MQCFSFYQISYQLCNTLGDFKYGVRGQCWCLQSNVSSNFNPMGFINR